MPKFHIGKRGNTAVCHAKGNCPLGGEEAHGQSREEVQTIIDSYYETEEAIRKHKELPITENAFELAGRLKAFKERQQELVKSINETERYNSNIKQEYSYYGSIQEIEKAIANNAENVANEEVYKSNRDMIMAEYEDYKAKELDNIKKSNPFGDRLTITDNGAAFVDKIQKDEWPAYNHIKDQLSKIKEEKNKYIEATLAYKPKGKAYSEREIAEMKQDLERLKNQEKPIDTTEARKEYEEVSFQVKQYEDLYKQQLFEERTGHKLSELEPVNKEGSRKVKLDDNGNYINVYAKHNGETFKVINSHHEGNSSYLEVQTLNGDKKRLSLVTNWNWRMTTEREAYNSLPNVFTVEDDKGTLSQEPIKFPKIVFDSSD